MRPEPGPLSLLPETTPPSEIEPGGFGDLARADMLPAGLFDGDLVSAGASINADWLSPPGNDLAPFVDPALAYANEIASVDNVAMFGEIDPNMQEGDGLVLQSYSTMPGEAWDAVPSELQVPGTPTLPIQPGLPTVTIGKVGQPTNQNFVVGEQYEIRCTVVQPVGGGAEIANLLLIMQSFLRPGDPQQYNIGRTGSSGVLVYLGVWTAAHQGQWYISWIIQGTNIGINAGNDDFFVAAAPGGGGGGGTPAPTITVQVTNLVTGSHTLFRVGQDFTLTVTGPANSLIEVTFQPGSKYTGSGSLGFTDGTGRFDYSGRYLASDIGHYIETYTVGGVAWPGTLVLDVTA